MAEIRNVSISGDAAKGLTAFGGARRTRKQGGGFNSAPGPAITMGASNVASARRMASSANAFHGGVRVAHGGGLQVAPAPAAPTPMINLPASPLPLASPIGGPVAPNAMSKSAVNLLQPVVKGGTKKSLVLAPPKKTKSKVHLAPPASGKRSTKGTRKIRVQLSCMKKRLTRAKTIKAESKQKPIAELRRILEEAKLVKPRADGKEVPESVLRDIYQDYMLLRNRVL